MSAPDVTAYACDACGAEPGEPCIPMCIGEAAHLDEIAVVDLREQTCKVCGAPALCSWFGFGHADHFCRAHNPMTGEWLSSIGVES